MAPLKQRGIGGFTLLEMLIGLVLLGLILSILFSALRLGAASWDSAESKLASVAERELAIRALRRELALALPVPHRAEDEGGEVFFAGYPDRFAWITPFPAHRGGGLYELRLEIGSTDHGDGLVLKYRPHHPNNADREGGRGSESVLLIEGVASLRVQYYGAVNEGFDREWSEEWSADQRLPELIRIEFPHRTAASESEHMVHVAVAPRQSIQIRELKFDDRYRP